MKYYVVVDGDEHTVELTERLGCLEVHYDGEPVEARYEEVDRLGQVALYLGRRSFAVSLEGDRGRGCTRVDICTNSLKL